MRRHRQWTVNVGIWDANGTMTVAGVERVGTRVIRMIDNGAPVTGEPSGQARGTKANAAKTKGKTRTIKTEAGASIKVATRATRTRTRPIIGQRDPLTERPITSTLSN